jgi:hypothetical protein
MHMVVPETRRNRVPRAIKDLSGLRNLHLRATSHRGNRFALDE